MIGTLIQVERMKQIYLHGPGGGGGGGVLGPKNDGGVPLAAENWTQKD